MFRTKHGFMAGLPVDFFCIYQFYFNPEMSINLINDIFTCKTFIVFILHNNIVKA